MVSDKIIDEEKDPENDSQDILDKNISKKRRKKIVSKEDDPDIPKPP